MPAGVRQNASGSGQFRTTATCVSAIASQSGGCPWMWWRATAGREERSRIGIQGGDSMRKPLPEMMFIDPEKSRLSMLKSWVLDNDVTEIEMKERQFWNFAQLQPVAEKPWTTFMGRAISVPDMPIDAQKQLGVFDKRTLGNI
jgi:hypothetical protein